MFLLEALEFIIHLGRVTHSTGLVHRPHTCIVHAAMVGRHFVVALVTFIYAVVAFTVLIVSRTKTSLGVRVLLTTTATFAVVSTTSYTAGAHGNLCGIVKFALSTWS